MLAIVALSLLMVVAAPASADSGCKNGKFVGSYTTPVVFPDVWGDGTNVAHTYVLQLNLHNDGTATQDFSGFPDVMLSLGTGTPFVGSWICRKDGKLVVTMISTIYGSTTDAINHPTTVPDPPPVDLFLVASSRDTFLFTVTDDNTLTRIQARRRNYPPDQDPSDPAEGTLGSLNTNVVVYNRLVASDADLLAP
jgi:hypothetical protein